MSETPLFIPAIEAHALPARRIDQTFEIRVMQPLLRRGETTRFPVLYLTDANAHFGMTSAIAQQLQLAGEVGRFILVGIGYPGDHALVGELLRRRDLIPARRRKLSEVTLARRVAGVLQPAQEKVGEADNFIAFIREQLIPFVNERFSTAPEARGYAGHSLGGGLGAHALLAHPDLFDRCILASPSLTFDGDEYLLDEAREFAAASRLRARVFIGVGEEEENSTVASIAKARFVSSARRLAEILRSSAGGSTDLYLRIYAGETHSSVWPFAFTHGLRRLFPPEQH
ncbi:MAG TPA: alpha/beta hydrolase-fold protein [Steroidobacteraceae bacterium]|nr:alpha/beta hydrolase-fold protein [Steroidobacteraceae bacterium]